MRFNQVNDAKSWYPSVAGTLRQTFAVVGERSHYTDVVTALSLPLIGATVARVSEFPLSLLVVFVRRL
jgi:hypothetical protein